MNFVELCDMVRREGGVSGAPITTVSGAVPAETDRIKNWVRDSWLDIQSMRPNWRFLYYESSFIVPQYASVITPPEFTADVVAEWDASACRLAKSTEPRSKSQTLQVVPYDHFKDYIGLDPAKTGRPATIAVHPRTEAIHLAPSADAEYEFFFDYFRIPQRLDYDGEEPAVPARYHPLIAWHAIERYGGYEVAPDAVMRARDRGMVLMQALIRDQLPAMSLGTMHGW